MKRNPTVGLNRAGKAAPRAATCLVLAVALFVAESAGAQDGESLFEQTCAACHTIGGGRLVGPDLEGVTERRDEEWLISFIQSSSRMIEEGDPVAVELFDEFNQMPMPDQTYSAAQVRQILDFIREQSDGEPVSAAAEAAPAPAEAVPADQAAADSAEAAQRGRKLFTGQIRFADGGPSCSACHTVDVAGITTGGTLARDLTTSYTRLSEPGLRAVITNPPFPAMAAAMRDAPAGEEVDDLIAFLRSAEQEETPGRNYARLLLLAGLGGFAVLLLVGAAAWSGRARREVNHAVYARQISST